MYAQEFQDLLHYIDRHPEYKKELRLRLLDEELIALPEKFAELVKAFHAFAAAVERRLIKLEEDITGLQAGQRSLEIQVAQLIGDNTETKVRRNILNIARDHLSMVKGIILHAQGRNADQAFTRLIDQAETDQIISEDESEDLSATDLIIRGRRRGDTTPVYAVFEISRTIHLNDIQRAQSRAETLTKAAGYETIPAVIGAAIDPGQQRQAEESGATVIIPLLFQPDQPRD